MSFRLAALAPALVLALATAASAQEAVPTNQQPQPPRLPAPIESAQLNQLDAWSVSALSRAEGALPQNLWADSDADFIAALFDKLPTVYESPAALALARRVLFTGGDAPPRGDRALAARERFEALGRMGAANQLANLASGSGGSLSDPAIAQFAAQAELARGDRNAACTRGRTATEQNAFLHRLRAFCSATTGDRAAAQLALEAPGAADPWYTGAVNAAGGAPGARPPAARYDNSLATQLSIAAGLRPGPNPLQNASTLSLIALVSSDTAPQPVRAQATTLAFRRGTISAESARRVLLATPAEITSGLPPIVTALRQVQGAPGSMQAAQAIADVLRQATAPADFIAAARFFRTDIAALTTAPDPASTVLFARAAIASGDVALADRLIESARRANVDAATLAPLEAAQAVLKNTRDAAAAAVVARRIQAAGASLAPAAARDVAIMGAAGFPIDGAAQRFLLANPTTTGVRADPGAMAALGRPPVRAGESALLLVIASGAGPARLDTDSVVQIITTLRALRLDADARAFAVEAILAGPPS